MVHTAAGGALGRQRLTLRSCVLRVSAPRLEQAEPSPSDEVPITRARYSAGAFAPPATPVVAKDTSRAAIAPLRGAHLSPQVLPEEDSRQRRTPLTDKQLEDFSSLVLGSSSNVWSAEERNIPASTSYSDHSLDAVVGKLKAGQSKQGVLAALKELTVRGELEAIVRGLQDFGKADLEAIIRRWRYQDFLEAVTASQKAKLALQFAKLAMPYVRKPALLTMSVLTVCAQCRDLDAGMTVVELARKHAVAVDAHMLTSLIKVCKAVGNVDRAYRVYLDMRSAGHRIDSHVYGALIATCAEAMKRDLAVMHERKDQYVLLERAFQYVADAEAAGVALAPPVWNSLVVCAGRSGELNRAFEVLTMMQQRGVGANAATYGSLIESCVCARQPEKALRVFEVALQKGFQSEVKIYTQALSACMLPLPHAWERAQDIYAALQRASPSVRPDKKFFACLMAVAGRCGRLDTSFELLGEMAAEGIRPSPTTVSAIIYACLERGNLALARRAYDLCARQGVYPVVSQFNRMMDVYASECRFGEVVSLLSDMTAAGRSPNLNTYRIVINACAFTDQAGLAFQVFALMHANKVPILQQGVAQAIYYMLIKACYGQTRYLWVPAGYPPLGPPVSPPAATAGAAAAVAAAAAGGGGGGGSAATGTLAAHSPHPHPGRGLPAERGKEAERLLAALGAHKLRRGAHQSNPFDGPPDTIDWASHALSAFHHMLSRGFRPTLELLDCLLSCMRAMMLPAGEPGSLEAAKPQYVSPFVPVRSRNEVFEVAFEPRAFAVLDEAIAKGLVPPYDPEAPMVVDMRNMPPVVAEVYVLHVLLTLDRRVRRRQADALSAGDSAAATGSISLGYYNSITLLVPPFDPDLVKWPSYVDRLMNRYTAMMEPEERAQLRHRSEYRRARARRRRRRIAAEKAAAAAAAAASVDVDADEDADGMDSDSDAAFGPLGGVAGSSYDELEAAMSGGEEDDHVSARDPWRHEDDMVTGGGEDGGTAAAGGAPNGGDGAYVADSTTGLAVAATLQRMKVWMDMDYVNGTITVFAVEVTRWLKRRRQAAEAASAAAAAAAAPVDRGASGDGPGAGLTAAAAAGGLGSPSAGRGVAAAGPTAGVGMMAGSLAGALTSARMMGIGGLRSRGAAVEHQQRNIRLGMMAATGGGGAGPAGRAGPGSGQAGAPVGVASSGSSASGQQQQGSTGRSLFGGHANAAGSGSSASSSGGEVNGPRAMPTRAHSAPQPGASSSSASPAAASGSVRSGHRPPPQPLVNGAREPRRAGAHGAEGPSHARRHDAGAASTTASPHGVNGHPNGSSSAGSGAAHGAAYNGNGNGDSHHAALPQQHQGHWRGAAVSVPQQHVEVTMGPGLPVKLAVAATAAEPAVPAVASGVAASG